jgi:AcrR family transcriptional regulator
VLRQHEPCIEANTLDHLRCCLPNASRPPSDAAAERTRSLSQLNIVFMFLLESHYHLRYCFLRDSEREPWRTQMLSKCAFAFGASSLLLASTLVGCGDDTTGSGGSGGGDGGGSTTTTTSSTTTTTSTTTTGAGGAGGEGGAAAACNVTLPTSYDGANFPTNAAESLGIRTRLGALNQLMRDAEVDLLVTPTVTELNALFEAGAPSLRTLTTNYYAGVVDGVFTRFEAAAGRTWAPVDPPVAPGGKYGAYIYDERGLDLRQIVEKGLFEALFYRRFHQLASDTTEPLDQATLDALLGLYGAHPDFPGVSEGAPVVTNPDRIAAQYLERRSPKDASDPSLPADANDPGPYFRVKNEFLFAQAAIADGSPECQAAAREAVGRVLAEWERGIAATTVYYFNAAATSLGADNATETQLSNGLHGYGEGIAFMWGFRTLPAGSRLITDVQIDALLASVNAPIDMPSTAYQFVTDSSQITKLVTAIDTLKALYQFSDAEIEIFKTNY